MHTVYELWGAQDPAGLLGARAGVQHAVAHGAEAPLIFWRARSRLYQSEILQVNMRLKAFAEIYTMQSFAQL